MAPNIRCCSGPLCATTRPVSVSRRRDREPPRPPRSRRAVPDSGGPGDDGPWAVLSPGLGFQGPVGWTAREGPAHWRLSQLSTPTRPGGHFIIACAARWEDPTLAPRNFSTFERRRRRRRRTRYIAAPSTHPRFCLPAPCLDPATESASPAAAVPVSVQSVRPFGPPASQPASQFRRARAHAPPPSHDDARARLRFVRLPRQHLPVDHGRGHFPAPRPAAAVQGQDWAHRLVRHRCVDE